MQEFIDITTIIIRLIYILGSKSTTTGKFYFIAYQYYFIDYLVFVVTNTQVDNRIQFNIQRACGRNLITSILIIQFPLYHFYCNKQTFVSCNLLNLTTKKEVWLFVTNIKINNMALRNFQTILFVGVLFLVRVFLVFIISSVSFALSQLYSVYSNYTEFPIIQWIRNFHQ
jgi:hypothetical protein